MAKRVSTDEKLIKIINFFKASQDIYNIKDLEKKIPKECGISSMLVPDLIKKLLDDNLISVEKCGASNIFFCFKFQQHHHFQCESEKSLLAIESFKEENIKKEKQLEKLKKVEGNKESSENMTNLLKEYNELKEKVSKIEESRKQLKDCSVGEYKKMGEENEMNKKKVNGLTDSIFTIQGHMSSKYNIGRRDFNKTFGVDDELDYV
jgi:hypothetical protein